MLNFFSSQNLFLKLSECKKETSKFISFFLYAFLFLLVLLFIKAQPLVIIRYGHDVITYFDYIYKFSLGLRPGEGIWSAYGSLPFWFMLNMSKLIGTSTSLIWLFLLSIFFLWTPLFVRSSNIQKAKFLLLCTILLGIYHLGDRNAITYANFYNRVCSFLMLGVMIFCNHENEDDLYNFYSGISLFALLNIKLSYFGLTLIYLVVFRRKYIKRWLCIFLLAELFYFALVDHSLFNYLKTNNLISTVYKEHLYLKIKEILRGDQDFLSYYFYILPIGYFVTLNKNFLAKVVLSSSLVLLSQQFNYLVSPEGILILNACYLFDIIKSNEIKKIKYILVIPAFFSIYLILNPYIKSYQLNFHNRHATYQNFSEVFKINSLYIKGADGAGNENYLEVTQDAIEAASFCKRKLKKCSAIAVISFEDFVTRELKMNAAPINLIPMQYSYNFNKNIYPNPKIYFGNVNYLLLRTYDPESSNPFVVIYKDYINQYKSCYTNKSWKLLCKN